MIVKESSYTKCGECNNNKDYVPEVHACDMCETEFEQEQEKLTFTIFGDKWSNNTSSDAQTLEFCNWNCVIKYLRKLDKPFDFFDLPFVYPENLEEFLNLLQDDVEERRRRIYKEVRNYLYESGGKDFVPELYEKMFSNLELFK